MGPANAIRANIENIEERAAVALVPLYPVSELRGEDIYVPVAVHVCRVNNSSWQGASRVGEWVVPAPLNRAKA